MRGKEPASCAQVLRQGITPACAGKRGCSCRFHMPPGDHPRVCGEKPLGHRCQCVLLGSPPRMRGKGIAIFRQLHHGRITPAYAGKSRLWRRPGTRCRDHPRVCGEKHQTFDSAAFPTGSPPRMRGKVRNVIELVCANGITPAYAGKSLTLTVLASLSWDHPRVCGEKDLTTERIHWFRGSPPRMRGKGGATSDIILHPGITPAYAGKSPLPPCRPVSPARFSGSGRHGPTLHPGRGCSHCPHKRRC